MHTLALSLSLSLTKNPMQAAGSVEGVPTVTNQMGQLQISTSVANPTPYAHTSPYTPQAPAAAAPLALAQPQSTAQYKITTSQGTTYAQQAQGGWMFSRNPISSTPMLQTQSVSSQTGARVCVSVCVCVCVCMCMCVLVV